MRIIVVAAVLLCLTNCKSEEPNIASDGCLSDDCNAPLDTSSPSRLVTYTEEREECAHYTPNRMALFGEFHSHTGFSFDARSYDNVLTPVDALAFARGEEVLLSPLGPDGKGTRPVSLDRPLDFAAITDHTVKFTNHTEQFI